MAAGEAIDEGNILARKVSSINNAHIPLVISLDTRDLFTSLYTQRTSVDKCILCDVSVIRYEDERRNVAKFIWIPGKQNLADPKRSDSPLTDAQRCCIENSRLPFQFPTA